MLAMNGRPLRGHTLTEMMAVLAIVVVMAAIALPNLQRMLLWYQVRGTANELFAAIDLTRSQAIARNSRVMMMPADPQGADWRQGWVVFVDKNGNRSLDPADELIFQQGSVRPGIAIRSAFSSAPAPFYIAYNGAGRSCSAGNSTAARWGTVSVLAGSNTRHIKINMLGRVRMCDPQAEPRNCSGAGGD